MALNLSHLIAADAPLLNTSDGDQTLISPSEPFTYPLYSIPPSPLLSEHPSPLKTPDPEPVCFPTHQLFDLAELTPPSSPPDSTNISTAGSVNSTGSKRSASPPPPAAKKRAVGERVSTKDFVPPDVSGLSKREARLVKNRAAAFLSRQRKREEFECMEIRVAELEQENRRLLALTQLDQSQISAVSSDGLVSEVVSLKAQLAAAQEHAKSLSAQLELRKDDPSPVIKVESQDSVSTASSSPRSTGPSSAHKSSASLGLMVLLCALPSLLSMRMQPPATLDNGFAVSNAFHYSAQSALDFDFDNSMFAPNDFDWSYSTLMDLDGDHSSNGPKKLEFMGTDSLEGESGLRDLGDLDISFDTAASNDGKIRVRIHPHPTSSSASSRSVSRGTTPEVDDSSMFPSNASSPRSRSSTLAESLSALTTSSSDPFLGATSLLDDDDIDMMGSYNKDDNLHGSTFDKGTSFLSSLSSSLSSLSGDVLNGLSSGRKRVKIALKSAPQAATEGGEWEVQIC